MPDASQSYVTNPARTDTEQTNSPGDTATSSGETHADASAKPTMSDPTSVTIIGGPPNLFRRCAPEDRSDLDGEYDPDAYFLTGTTETYTGAQQLRYELPGNPPVLYPGNAHSGKAEHLTVNGIDIVVCTKAADLSDIATYEQNGTLNTDTETIILSNLLSVELKMDQLTAEMRGLDAYKAELQPERLSGSYTHISGAINAGYCREWDGLLVRGAGMGDGNSGSNFLSLTITADGIVMDETIDASKLGLKAIEGVGPKTAERLKENGYNSTDAIATADPEELQEVKGFGEKKTAQVTRSATAISDGRVITTSDTPVPGSNPVFIDIETDGLNPTAVWLIGVKDGIDGNYMSFIETDPEDAGKAVESFMMWFSANASHRTVMAWNGWNFDFPVIRKHIQTHCPQYLDDWKRASKRDPLRWARDLNNAILPGRTNKLEHVAEALGWDGHQTGLSGAEVARRFRAWMENPCEENELDWERHKQYCEDDVEALEHIYLALQDANRLASTDTEPSIDVEEETSQGSLFESY